MTVRNHNSGKLVELNIEEIAKIGNVVGAGSGFIASDNIDSPAYLGNDYIDSIGNFRVGSPFKIRFTMMLFCIHGEMDLQINLVSHTLHAGEMLMVYEGSVAMGMSMDPDIRLFLIGFTSEFVNSFPPSRTINRMFGYFLSQPVVGLPEKDITDLFSLYRVVNRRLAVEGFKMKRELVWSGLETMACVISESLTDNGNIDAGLTRKQVMVRDFIRLVGKYGS
ncbi:MAG: hypothetical protein K2H18_02070, partial [Muribaculaceae bacterium]|nr:hypothetical protein [Muribaculaceae bacterium]